MVGGIVLIALGIPLVVAGWRAWSGGWRSWAAVRGFPVYNGPIATFPGMGVCLVCVGIATLGAGSGVGGIGVVVLIAGAGLDVTHPQWFGPRWYRAGEWPQPADGFGRYRAARQHGKEPVDGRLTLGPDAITFVPAQGASGIEIPWADVRGARAEGPSSLCIDATGETRFTLKRPQRAAKRIAGIVRLRAGSPHAAAAGRRSRIEPL